MGALVILIAIALFSASSRGSDGYDAKWAADSLCRQKQLQWVFTLRSFEVRMARRPFATRHFTPSEVVTIGSHMVRCRKAWRAA